MVAFALVWLHVGIVAGSEVSGLHLDGANAVVHFGPNGECKLSLENGALSSNCPIVAPEMAPLPPGPPPVPPSIPPQPPLAPPGPPNLPPIPFSDHPVEFLDLGGSDRYSSGFSAGTYVYYAPGHNTGKVVRIAKSDFTASGVTYLDLTQATGGTGFTGNAEGFSDGSYGYFPGRANGKLARVLLSSFTLADVSFLDLASVNAAYTGFVSGAIAGGFAYLTSSSTSSHIVRVDLNTFDAAGVDSIDLQPIDADAKGFNAIRIHDGYGYCVGGHNGAASHGKQVRFSLPDFPSSTVDIVDVDGVDGNTNLDGFGSGFIAGGFLWLVPYYGGGRHSGDAARIALDNFAAAGVQTHDFAASDGNLKKFIGGFSDDTFAYFSPRGYKRVLRLPLSGQPADFTNEASWQLNLETKSPPNTNSIRELSGAFTDGEFAYLIGGDYSYTLRFPVERHTPTFANHG